MVGALSSASGDETFDLVASHAGIPTVIVLGSCLQARSEGEDVAGLCDDLFAHEQEIRDRAESLPSYYPTPTDYGFDQAMGSGGSD